MQLKQWRKSSFSTSDGNGGGVEVMALLDGQTGLRDSKHPEATHLTFTRAETTAWIKGVKAGELDDLC